MCPSANFVAKMALNGGKNQQNSSKEVPKKSKKGRNRQDRVPRPASNTDCVIEKPSNSSRVRAASSSPKLDPSRQSPYAAPRFFSAPAPVHLPPPPSNWILENRSCASEAERDVLSSSLKAMLKVCWVFISFCLTWLIYRCQSRFMDIDWPGWYMTFTDGGLLFWSLIICKLSLDSKVRYIK